jgi:hypothetical protein
MKELALNLSYRLMILMACLLMGTAFVGCGDDDDGGDENEAGEDGGAGTGGTRAGSGGSAGNAGSNAGTGGSRAGTGGSNSGTGGGSGMDIDEDAGLDEADGGDEDAG